MSWPSAIWIEPGNSLKMMRLADVMTMSLAGRLLVCSAEHIL